MIRLPLSWILPAYVIFGLLFIMALWLWANWMRKRRETEVLRYRVQCIICAFPFEDRSDTSLPSCPKCGSLNERDLT